MELFELDINALSKGKKEAFFSYCYKKFFVALCLFAQKFSIGKEAAEDIVQEIFYKLYEERQIFHNILTLQSYLYSSVKNSCLNYIRDEKKDENSVKVITVTKFIIMTLHLLTTLSKTKCTENYINF